MREGQTDRLALVGRKIVDRQTAKNKLGDFCTAANKNYCRGDTWTHTGPMALAQQPS